MLFVRSLLFAAIFYGGTVLMIFAAFVIFLFGVEATRAHGLRWARFHRWCARALLGITSRVEGEVPDGPVLCAGKHQSMYETIEMLLILGRPAVVLKRELADIPLWGRIAEAYGAIPIDRAGSATALRGMIRAARAAVAEQRSILIFPEGTRVAPGERPPLRAGFAGLYRMLALPVAPVALNSGQLMPRQRFIKRAGVVTFRFGELIPPGLPRDEVEARTHAAINAMEP